MLEAAVVDEVVAELKEIERTSGWRKVLSVAEIVVEKVFSGDAEASRDPRRRSNSLRTIAAHPACPFRKSRLAESVGLYLLHRDEPYIRECERLGPSHVAATLALSPRERHVLLRQADREAWSVRQLRAAVIQLRRKAGERRGRPAAPAAQRAETCLKNAIAALQQSSKILRAAATPTGEEQARLNRLVAEAGSVLDQLTLSVAKRRARRSGVVPAVVPRQVAS